MLIYRMNPQIQIDPMDKRLKLNPQQIHFTLSLHSTSIIKISYSSPKTANLLVLENHFIKNNYDIKYKNYHP